MKLPLRDTITYDILRKIVDFQLITVIFNMFPWSLGKDARSHETLENYCEVRSPM